MCPVKHILPPTYCCQTWWHSLTITAYIHGISRSKIRSISGGHSLPAASVHRAGPSAHPYPRRNVSEELPVFGLLLVRHLAGHGGGGCISLAHHHSGPAEVAAAVLRGGASSAAGREQHGRAAAAPPSATALKGPAGSLCLLLPVCKPSGASS